MYAALDKNTIKNEILLYLSVAKRGYVTKSGPMDRNIRFFLLKQLA